MSGAWVIVLVVIGSICVIAFASWMVYQMNLREELAAREAQIEAIEAQIEAADDQIEELEDRIAARERWMRRAERYRAQRGADRMSG